MLVEAYVEAILADELLADRIWEQWRCGRISDDLAALAWCIVAAQGSCPPEGPYVGNSRPN